MDFVHRPFRVSLRRMPDANFHTVYMNAELLAVECKVCGRRTTLDKNAAPQIRRGNMTELRAVRFRCGNRACGASQVRLSIPASEAEATMWLAGDPLPEGREVRHDRDPSD